MTHLRQVLCDPLELYQLPATLLERGLLLAELQLESLPVELEEVLARRVELPAALFRYTMSCTSIGCPLNREPTL